MTGRWPANLVLTHLSGCQRVGAKKVKSTSTDRPAPVRRSGVHAPAGGHQTVGRQQPPVKGYADDDGNETVEAWDCEPGCPVAELDEQSGVLVSGQVKPGYMKNSSTQPSRGGYEGGFQDTLLTGYSDTGGASRFFKQVQQMGDTTMAGLLTIAVVRKPISEGSIAKNVLKHGTGGINIDKCRVGTGPSQGGSVSGATAFGQGTGWNSHENRTTEIDRTMAAGRWPANSLMAHRPGCERVGVRKVKSDGHYPKARPAGSQMSGPSGHGGQDDLEESYTDGETVEAWDCEPGCPVANLDEQSGAVRSSGFRPPTYNSEREGCSTTFRPTQGQLYADKGGASRFFQPLQSDTDLISYLLDLVVPDDQRPRGCIAEPDAKLALWKDYGAEAFVAIVTRGTPTAKQAEHMLRVLKPGGHLLLISPVSQPTGHTGMCRIEDAGFEIRDTILVAGEPGIMHYVPKAPRRERDAGCHDLSGKSGAQAVERKEGTDGLKSPRAGAGRTASHVKNFHPTCKPIEIMEKLLADVPKDKPVWDPFLGSGTTGIACLKTGHDFVGVERDVEYAQIADARIRHWDRAIPARWLGATIESDVPQPETEEDGFDDWLFGED